MNPIDWQAFHDRTLDAAEMEQVRFALKTKPELQEEYQAFQDFLQSLQDLRQVEPVPVEKLRFNLQKVAPKPRFQKWWILVGTAILATLCVAYFAKKKDDTNFLSTKLVGSMNGGTPQADMEFVNSLTKLDVGLLRPPSGTTSWTIGCGKDWARYSFSGASGVLLVDVRANDGRLDKYDIDFSHGRPFRIAGDGLGWSNCGRIFYLHGIDRSQMWDLAKDIKLQTEAWH